MSARTSLRTGLVVVLIVCATGVGLVSIRSSRAALAVLEACDALARGDLERTLALTANRIGTDDTGRTAAECRCRALVARNDRAGCAALLESLWSRPGGADWMPAADLAALAIAERRAQGRTREAATLAHRAGLAHPDDLQLFALELDTRASVEVEARVLEELALRLPSHGERAAELRAVLAQRHLRAGDPAAALRVLGAQPPPGSRELSLWFDTRAMAFALADDLGGLRRSIAEWGAAGGDPDELRGRYALALSIAGLRDPDHDTIGLLREALLANAESPDASLRAGLVIRLVLSLAQARRLPEALEIYDRHREWLPEGGLSREELERAARVQELADASPSARRGTLRFELESVPEGAQLRVSPDLETPLDAPYERLPVPADGSLAVARAEGEAPVRWVLRGEDAVLASGQVQPRAGDERRVRVTPHAPRPIAPEHARTRGAADGRRRVALVLLDCGDWRIVRYLMARGELPVLASLLRAGHRAVLDSDPPLTAAALESLVWPKRRGDASLLGLVHRMGVELAGLASIGDNPFAQLAWVLPESDDLFSTIGAGERRAANLLLSHGGIRAGRHGEISGPRGERRRIEIGSSARDLDADERARWPALAAPESEQDRLYVRTIAAEMDATLSLLRAGEVDFSAVRIEPLDILTHEHFAGLVAEAQDDGAGFLYDVYRYLDARLADVDATLDADDVLIVMSDHGIRTAMEHARQALFVAVGDGVPAGRAAGAPALRGVSRAVADLLGVATDWPDTGVASFASARPLATTRASADPPPER